LPSWAMIISTCPCSCWRTATDTITSKEIVYSDFLLDVQFGAQYIATHTLSS
jgi:hypothetical protein